MRLALGVYQDSLWYSGCRLNYLHAMLVASGGRPANTEFHSTQAGGIHSEACTIAARAADDDSQCHKGGHVDPCCTSLRKAGYLAAIEPTGLSQGVTGKAGYLAAIEPTGLSQGVTDSDKKISSSLTSLTHSTRLRRCHAPDSDDDDETTPAHLGSAPVAPDVAARSSIAPTQAGADDDDDDDEVTKLLPLLDKQLLSAQEELRLYNEAFAARLLHQGLLNRQNWEHPEAHSQKANVSQSCSGLAAGLCSEDSSALPRYVVEPPRYITAEHVAQLFQCRGYDPQQGRRAFAIHHSRACGTAVPVPRLRPAAG